MNPTELQPSQDGQATLADVGPLPWAKARSATNALAELDMHESHHLSKSRRKPVGPARWGWWRSIAFALLALVIPPAVNGRGLSEYDVSGDAKTIEGSALTVKASDDGVSVDTAKVIKADIEASNGVIHAIDTDVMPA